MEIISGNGQSARVLTFLPNPVVVRVTDASGRPIVGKVVNFRATSGSGAVWAGSAETNAQGMARDHWMMGPRAGDPQVLEVRATDQETGERQLLGVFKAIATTPPVLLSRTVVSADSVSFRVGWQFASSSPNQPSTFVWQTGLNGNAWTMSGEMKGSEFTYRAPIDPTISTYWFCMRIRDQDGFYSNWECIAFDRPQ